MHRAHLSPLGHTLVFSFSFFLPHRSLLSPLFPPPTALPVSRTRPAKTINNCRDREPPTPRLLLLCVRLPLPCATLENRVTPPESREPSLCRCRLVNVRKGNRHLSLCLVRASTQEAQRLAFPTFGACSSPSQRLMTQTSRRLRHSTPSVSR